MFLSVVTKNFFWGGGGGGAQEKLIYRGDCLKTGAGGLRTRLSKSVKQVSPQITISESMKSGRIRLIFSHDSHKNNLQFTPEQK